MAVTISGMFGAGHTYFANSPVVISINGLQWPSASPFNIVRVYVIYEGRRVGEFHADTGRQSSIEFDISSALRTIWSDYGFAAEISQVKSTGTVIRGYRSYSLEVLTEYLDDNDGEFTQTSSGTFSGGQCAIGGFTELERSMVGSQENADVSYHEQENRRFGDASTKPTDSPEHVGSTSITTDG